MWLYKMLPWFSNQYLLNGTIYFSTLRSIDWLLLVMNYCFTIINITLRENYHKNAWLERRKVSFNFEKTFYCEFFRPVCHSNYSARFAKHRYFFLKILVVSCKLGLLHIFVVVFKNPIERKISVWDFYP